MSTSSRSEGPLPAVDERLVMPETRYEIIDGKVEYVVPADPPHASRHSKISALLEAYVRDGYDVAIDMLTRTSHESDMAPDASVYPSDPDPETGGRRLEVIAVEVMNSERPGHAAKKARALVERGVRRVFAVDVVHKRALEWSRATDTWEILSPDGAIEDEVFVLPLPIRALVDAAKADDAVASALLAKGNPVLQDALSEAKAEGVSLGKVAALLAVLSARRLYVSRPITDRIRAERDEAVIDAWLARALTCANAEDLFNR